MSKIYGVFWVIMLIMLGSVLIKDIVCPASPTKIEIPEFNGKILPAQEVNHQVFSIKKDFAEVEKWGEESILTYGINKFEGYRHYEKLIFEAWRPDPLTSNIMQSASKIIELPNWSNPTIIYPTAEIIKDGNYIYVIPQKKFLNLKILIVLMSILGGIIFAAHRLKV